MLNFLRNKLRENAPKHFQKYWKVYATLGLVTLAILLTMFAFPVPITTLLAGWLGTYTAIEPLFMLSVMLESGGVFANLIAGLLVGAAVAVASQVFRFTNYLARQFYNSFFLDAKEWKKAFAFLFPSAVSGTTAAISFAVSAFTVGSVAATALATAATGGIVTAIIFGGMLAFLGVRLLVSRLERKVNRRCDLITVPDAGEEDPMKDNEVPYVLRSRLDHPHSFVKEMYKGGFRIYNIDKKKCKYVLLMDTSDPITREAALVFGDKFPRLNEANTEVTLTLWDRIRGRTLDRNQENSVTDDEYRDRTLQQVPHKSIKYSKIQDFVPEEKPLLQEPSAFAKCCAALCKKPVFRSEARLSRDSTSEKALLVPREGEEKRPDPIIVSTADASSSSSPELAANPNLVIIDKPKRSRFPWFAAMKVRADAPVIVPSESIEAPEKTVESRTSRFRFSLANPFAGIWKSPTHEAYTPIGADASDPAYVAPGAAPVAQQ